MKIAKLMIRDAITCRTADHLDRAAQLMWEHDIGSLPVIGDDGRAVGMVTDRDICMAAYTRGAALHDIPVAVAMAHEVFSCAPDDDVRSVEDELGLRQIRRMPVIDADGRVVGVVSLNDIARASQRSREVPPTEVAATLAAVCAPRELVAARA
jgi:CBS domain-containing protein